MHLLTSFALEYSKNAANASYIIRSDLPQMIFTDHLKAEQTSGYGVTALPYRKRLSPSRFPMATLDYTTHINPPIRSDNNPTANYTFTYIYA
jgi:hypothetical protein